MPANSLLDWKRQSRQSPIDPLMQRCWTNSLKPRDTVLAGSVKKFGSTAAVSNKACCGKSRRDSGTSGVNLTADGSI